MKGGQDARAPCTWEEIIMSLKKQYVQNQSTCNVTFNLSKDESGEAETVNLVGEFNNWNIATTPMEKFKNGNFTVLLKLEVGKEYQYRYLLNGKDWINDPAADKYAAVPEIGVDNSVVVVSQPPVEVAPEPPAKKATPVKEVAPEPPAKKASPAKSKRYRK
jgi:1,4-alpha-glucan branching enzyme